MRDPDCQQALDAYVMPAATVKEFTENVFEKYDIPISMLSELEHFSSTIDIVDITIGDRFFQKNFPLSEIVDKVKRLLEVLAYLPITTIRIKFLDRDGYVYVDRDLKVDTPNEFLANLYGQLDTAFSQSNIKKYRGEGENKDIVRAFQESLKLFSHQRVARYYFGGFTRKRPSSSTPRQTNVVKLFEVFHKKDIKELIEKHASVTSPFTFVEVEFSYGNDWIGEICQRKDGCIMLVSDFTATSDEVRVNQGNSIPYTFGMHMVNQLVGAVRENDKPHYSIERLSQAQGKNIGQEELYQLFV